MADESPSPEIGRHPIGTLVIILVYAALFAIGWFALYYGLFLRRGPVSG